MPQAVDQAGNIWETDAQGNPVRYVGKVGGQGIPSNPIKVRQAQTDIQKTQADIGKTAVDAQGKALDNAVIVQTMRPTVQKAQADANKAGDESSITQKKDATNAGVIGESQRAAALAQWGGGQALGGSLAEINRTFNAGPGATSGVAGLWDYNPFSGAKQAFDSAGSAVRGPVRNALGLTGGEANTAAEARMNMGGYIPEASDRDAIILDKIERLKRVRNQAALQAIPKLGGIPDANGNIIPLTPEQQQIYAAFAANGGATPQGHEDDLYSALLGHTSGNPPATGPGAPGAGPQNPAGGAGSPQLGLSRGESYTTPRDLAVAAAVNKAFQSGGSIQDLVAAVESTGGKVAPQDLANFQQALQARQNHQAVTFNPDSSGRRTPAQVMAGNAMMSPLGTAAATAVSGTGLNALDAIAPDQMQAIRALNPNMAAMGDIGGAIAGTSVMGSLGSKALGKLAPNWAGKILADTPWRKAARALAGDTAFGVTYGQNVNGDAATGALGGALGSAGGQLAGKAIGTAIGGAMRSQPGQYLADKVGDLTIGQQMGGAVKSLEDAAMSFPGIGDFIKARRNASLGGLNRAAFREASGGAVDGSGFQALDQFGNVTDSAYNSALGSKQFPLDQQFGQDMAQAQAGKANLMPDYQAKFDNAMQNRVDPVVQSGQMTGEEYQQAMRGLRDYKGATGVDGFESDYRGAIGSVQDALKSNVVRNGGQDVVSGLAGADRLYRGQKILEDAINRNRKDASGIGSDMFRPGDLTDAVFQNGKKFGGDAPLQQLARAAQEIIPSKLPDSGTARRMMTGSLGVMGLGAVTGGGTGAYGSEDNALGDGLSGAGAGGAAGLGLLGLLAAGGTKTGQRVLTKALFNRPDSIERIGRAISQRKGLFGSAAVPLILEGGNQ